MGRRGEGGGSILAAVFGGYIKMSLEAIILLSFRVDLVAMLEGNSGIERSDRTLTFVSRKPWFGAAVFAGLIVAGAIATFAKGDLGTIATPGNTASTVVLLIFFACILLSIVTRRGIAEIDLGARRLKVSWRFLGRWTKVVVDRSLDECRALGTIEFDTDDGPAYGVYIDLMDGTRHGIPLENSTFKEAAKVASQLSTATGIPRLDTKS
jgi:hypothetical protein